MTNEKVKRGTTRGARLSALLLLLGIAYGAHGIDARAGKSEDRPRRVAVLAYHRFSLSADDSMTVRVATFDAQLRFLREHGYRVVPLRDIVNWVSGTGAALPPKAVALTADDGHRSVYEVLRPIALREHLPFTLFVYPSAISNAAYALTWAQLKALQDSGLFDVQSHTYWHPNFNVERAHRTPDDFRRFAQRQLVDSRRRIESELGTHVDLLAWPFGIVDDELIAMASAAGYRAAVTIAGRTVDERAAPLALPRLLITDADTPAVLARRLGELDTKDTHAMRNTRLSRQITDTSHLP